MSTFFDSVRTFDSKLAIFHITTHAQSRNAFFFVANATPLCAETPQNGVIWLVGKLRMSKYNPAVRGNAAERGYLACRKTENVQI